MQQHYWWIAVVVVLSSVCAEENPPPLASKGDIDHVKLESGDTRKFEEIVENATLSAAFSGCGLCQQTGQCDHAFRGQPGQFCLGMASGAPCCCPLDAQCAANPYECRCRRVVRSYYNDGNDYHPRSHSGGVSGTFIYFALLLLCCVCCCYLPMRCARQGGEEQVAYAQPVATGQYGTYQGQQQPSYAYAPAPAVYDSAPYREGGGNSTMAAGALGALGGLGVGAALGSTFGGHNNGNNGYSGDTGGVSENTYTFSGDTGGGGYGNDFDGDDGTFAGDSC